MLLDRRLDKDTPEEDFAALVDEVKRSPHSAHILVEVLQERNPVYAGRSANATIRMRGYVIATFEKVGLPDSALPFIVEELASGRDAYLVAAAATALRGSSVRERWIVALLLKA